MGVRSAGGSHIKVGVLDVGSKPLDLREAGSWEFPPDVWLCARGGVYWESVSAFPTHFSVGDIGIF